MNYKDLPPEFGRWLGAQEDEAFFIFVQPVEGTGADVTIVSNPVQVEAAYKAYMSAFIDYTVQLMLAFEEGERDRALQDQDTEDE